MQVKKLYCVLLLILILSISGISQAKRTSIQFNSMLWNTFNIERYPEGDVFIHKELYATNMPPTNQNGTAIIRMNGEEIGVYTWLAFPRDNLYTQMIQFNLTKGKKHPLGLILEKSGDYEVEYRLADGTTFYKFPFKLERKSGGGTHEAYSTWKFEGDWEHYAYLIFDDKGTSAEKLRFVFWLRDFGGSEAASLVTAEIIRDKDGAKIARSTNTIRPSLHWLRHDLAFTSTFDPKGIPFEINTLKTANGFYTLNLKVKDQVFRQYKFEIRNGEIPLQGRQLIENTDPLRFIEGAGAAIWLKKL